MSLHQPDMSRIVDAIVIGFAANPFTRWVFDDPQLFLGHFPEAVGHFGGRALEHGTAFHTENCALVATRHSTGRRKTG